MRLAHRTPSLALTIVVITSWVMTALPSLTACGSSTSEPSEAGVDTEGGPAGACGEDAEGGEAGDSSGD
jgi:hypothetical protein